MFDFFRSLFEKFLRVPKVVRGKDKFIKIDFECDHITLGNPNAAWTICPEFLNENSVVYSFGIGYDVSFDLAIINNCDLKIYAFDPTPKSIEWVKNQNLPKQFILKEYGLADFDGKAKFHPPENPDYISATILERPTTENEAYKVDVKSLITIMRELGHDKIDILKMDIEGGEYTVIENIINSGIKPTQLLVEFHHRFGNVGVKQTINAVNKLRKYGYKVFHISKTGEEISFIQTELVKNMV
ncbi:MAG: FkbM family methyltransferase [Bacteroidota bacterium]